jgi:hypothetical protein
VTSVAFSADGKRVFGRDEDGKVLAWDSATGLLIDAPSSIPAGRSVAVHGNRRAVADGYLVRIERILTPAEQSQLRQEEERVQRILDARATREFHTAEAKTAENNYHPFAAVFHLDRLLPLLSGERPNLLKRRTAVLTAALKNAPDDTWAGRALARQVIGDPASVPARATLLTALATLAKPQDASNDTLHGVLLLRTSSPREAVLVLRAARNKRGPDAPPVEELLLALAHARLKQPAEARKHLHTAVAWMQRGNPTVKAASLLGRAGRQPFAALAVEHVDPRFNPLDHQTAHELKALRAEAEKALAH